MIPFADIVKRDATPLPDPPMDDRAWAHWVTSRWHDIASCPTCRVVAAAVKKAQQR